MDPEYALLKPRLLKAIAGKKTARGIATALHKALSSFASDIGMKPDIEVHMWSPSELKRRNAPQGAGCYVVSFEAGPYQWAVSFSNCGEAKRLMEPYYSFDLCIYTADDGQVAA